MIIRERMIVLKNQTFAESDLIVRGLTQKGSQISFIAKGALKSKRRFAGGVLEPISYIELDYRKSKGSLQSIQQAWVLESFPKLRTEWARLNLAFYFLKIMEKISQEGEADSSSLFHLLGNSLKQAETSSDLESLKILFQAKILFLQGVLSKKIPSQKLLNKSLEKHEKLNLNPGEKKSLLHSLNYNLQSYLT